MEELEKIATEIERDLQIALRENERLQSANDDEELLFAISN